MKLGPRPSPRVFATRLLPVVAFTAGSLSFGNVAYLSLSVAFIQILKARPASISWLACAVGAIRLASWQLRAPALEQAHRQRCPVRPACL